MAPGSGVCTLLSIYVLVNISHTDDIFYYPMMGNLSSDWHSDSTDSYIATSTSHSTNIGGSTTYCPQETAACWAEYHYGIQSPWSLHLESQDTFGYTNIEFSYHIRTVGDDLVCILSYDTSDGWQTIEHISTTSDKTHTFSNWDPSPNHNANGIQLHITSYSSLRDGSLQVCSFNEFKLTGDPISTYAQPSEPTKQPTQTPILAPHTTEQTHDNVHDEPVFEDDLMSFAKSTVGLCILIGVCVCVICITCCGIYLTMKRPRKNKEKEVNHVIDLKPRNDSHVKSVNVNHYPLKQIEPSSPLVNVNGADIHHNGCIDSNEDHEDEKEEQYVTGDNTREACDNEHTGDDDDDVLSEGIGVTAEVEDAQLMNDCKEDSRSDHSNDAIMSYPNTRNILTGLLGSESMADHEHLLSTNENDDDNVLHNYVISRSPGKHGDHGNGVLPSTEDIGEAMDEEI
eukprot:58208_1